LAPVIIVCPQGETREKMRKAKALSL
jgi:hypothetical protein